MWGKRSGYCSLQSRLRPEAPPHLFTFLCPYLEISRFPPLCGVQTLSPSQQSKKAGPTHWNSLGLTLTIHLLVESHVCSRVPLEPLVLFRLCFAEDWDCLACLPGSASEGKRFFFLIEMSGSEGG